MDVLVYVWNLIKICFVCLVCYCIYTGIKYLYIRMHPCVLACEKIKQELIANNICKYKAVLHNEFPVKSLQTFKRYTDSHYADEWFIRYAKNNEENVLRVVECIEYNMSHKDIILQKFHDITDRIDGLFAKSVNKYIIHTYYEWLDDAFPLSYCLNVTYLSPAGRNYYCQPWYWTLEDIRSISIKLFVSKRSYITENDDNVPNSIFHEEIHDKDVSVSTCNMLDNNLLPINENVLDPACAEYLRTHKCYNKDDYCRIWQKIGQKKIVPGCYIILNCTNHKVYVGQAQDIRKRMRQHFDGKSSDKHDNIDYAIVVSHDPILIRHLPLGKCGYFDLNEMERDLIRAYDCVYPKGYNKTKGNGYN